ncbi:hypothetical protein [Ruminococcus sp. NK3A76]|uniref:hypothetical protein n=1 Tax=Ruminococcus sp. NK3A76 TaxID=877411 RepID=UPI00048BB99A|nr:hypothetical protein [Ruminococcus sp. NK3A76]
MKLIPIITAALSACLVLSLCACSLIKDDESDAETGFVSIPVSELEEDANAAINKSYEQFKFREGMTVSVPDEIELLSFTQTEGFEKEHTDIFGKLFDGETLERVTPDNTPFITQGADEKYAIPTYGFHDEELKKHCYIHSDGFFAFFVDEAFTDPENGECIDLCFVDREADAAKSYDLGGEQVTISQAAEFAQRWCDEYYAPLEPDLDIKVKYIGVYQNDSGVISYDMTAVKLYKGIELESDVTIINDEHDLMKNVTSKLELVMRKKDSICFFTNGNGIVIPEQKGKVNELISLSSILDYLSAQLADLYNDIEITEISLRYTLEPETYDFVHGEQYYFPENKYNSSPTWEILIDIPKENRPTGYQSEDRLVAYFLVNAVTGEIVFDLETWNDEKAVIETPEITSGKGLEYKADKQSKTDTQKAEPAKAEDKKITIEAIAKSYENEQLTFEYESSSYTLPLPKERFAKQEMGISEFYPEIINNRYGIEVKAELVVNEDITEIKSCDVYTPNGKVYNMPTEFKPDGSLDTSYDFTFHKGKGSQCSFTNKNETINADLNDLPMYLKLDYKDGTTPVHFDGFMFNDGTFMMLSLYTNRVTDAGYEWSEEEVDYGTCFIGTVGKIKNERTELTLADGRTKLDIPVSLNDGEVSDGMTVMAMIYDEPSVYGSGAAKKYDYALIFTHPKDHLMLGEKLDDMAYATVGSLYNGVFHFVKKEQKNGKNYIGNS